MRRCPTASSNSTSPRPSSAQVSDFIAGQILEFGIPNCNSPHHPAPTQPGVPYTRRARDDRQPPETAPLVRAIIAATSFPFFGILSISLDTIALHPPASSNTKLFVNPKPALQGSFSKTNWHVKPGKKGLPSINLPANSLVLRAFTAFVPAPTRTFGTPACGHQISEP